ncbi:MAG: hypothetical protein V1817_04460 [Candidatus Micrarchaeota archaeon]
MKRFLAVLIGLLLVAPLAFAAAPDGTGPWADYAVSAAQGLRKDGSAVLATRSNTLFALGAADGPAEGTFYSLGFGGVLTLGFDNALVNGPGNDVKVYEITGLPYAMEYVKVEASYDAANWVTLAESAPRTAELDLGLACAHYIRLTDVSNPALFVSNGDGYDVDAVKALNSRATPCSLGVSITKTASSYEVYPSESVTYSYSVSNAGDFALENAGVSDDKCAPVTGPTGDDGDAVLEVGETWVYACTTQLSETTTNIATVTAEDEFGTVVTNSADATVAVKDPGCTMSQGYWKTHSEYGPAPYDSTWALVPSLGEDTLLYASGKTWYQVFWTPPKKGNAWYILSHQYMAAKLNVYSGADPRAAEDAVSDAEYLLGTYTPSSSLNQALRNEFLQTAGILDQYNNGYIGPGHCSDYEPIEP